MGNDAKQQNSRPTDTSHPANRFLVETALKSMATDDNKQNPRNRGEWVVHLGQSLMSDAEIDHQKILAALISSGVSADELHHYYIPEASRYLGEKWVTDEASFVDVTTGASRLQALFRRDHDIMDEHQILGRTTPLGQSVLMIIPQFEQHSLGAFVASEDMRSNGLSVRMAIGLNSAEIARLIKNNCFAMVGISVATWKSVENVYDFIEYMRSNVEGMPPVVIGGRVVEERANIERRSGADYAVKSVREAIDRCGLTTVSELPQCEVAL